MSSDTTRAVQIEAPYQLLERELGDWVDRYIQEIITVSQIPAPSLQEERRARHVEARFRAAGLAGVERDKVHNVIGRLPGKKGVARLGASAHLDTVFPAETDVTVVREGSILRGPGVGDNSSAVAALIILAELMVRAGYEPPSDIIFLANSGEEGLGNLLGIREFFGTYAHRADVDLGAMLIFDGSLGMLVNHAVTSRRLRVTATTDGGHSWKDFGRPSAIAVLARMVAAIYEISPPADPQTTYNVGVIRGGTSVNTIAQHAEMLIDMRSTCPDALAHLSDNVSAAIGRAAQGSKVAVELMGERPGGGIPLDHSLVTVIRDVGRQLGLTLKPTSASTDANWPLSLGVPAVTTGLTVGGGTHTTEEWIDTAHAPQAILWALGALLGAAGLAK